MKVYQFKIAIKNTKPPIWRRCLVPAGITFAQLSVILNEMMEWKSRPAYMFEFYQRKLQFVGQGQEKIFPKSFFYSRGSAEKLWIDEFMEQESWFSYTLENGISHRITIERTRMDGQPYPVMIKCKGSCPDAGEAVPDMDRLNESLKQRFYLTYGSPEAVTQAELYAKLDQNEWGFIGKLHPVNDSEQIKKSGHALMADIAEQLRAAIGAETPAELLEIMNGIKVKQDEEEDGQPQEPQRCTGITLKGLISDEKKSDLLEYAKSLRLRNLSVLNKDELAEKIANELLTPAVMRRRMYTLDDREIEYFEQVADSELLVKVDKEHEDTAMTLANLDYLAYYEDDFAEVPMDVKRVYARISTPEYHEERRRVVWMIKCLKTVILLYDSAPLRILRRVYRRKPGYNLGIPALVELFQMVPKEENPCALTGDMVVSKESIGNDLYKKIAGKQGECGYYIPTLKEIEACAQDDGIPGNASYERLQEFLEAQFNIKDQALKRLEYNIFRMVSTETDQQGVLEYLEEVGFPLPDKKSRKEFHDIMTDVAANTRMLYYRGFTRLEMLEKKYRDGIYLEDTRKSAAYMAAKSVAASMAGGRQERAAKIYPNDPCPCGSGKKYKKCCGKR